MVPTGPKCDLDGMAVVTRSHPNTLRELPSRCQTAAVIVVWWGETIGETIVFDLWIAISCHLLNEITSNLDSVNHGIDIYNNKTFSSACPGVVIKIFNFPQVFHRWFLSLISTWSSNHDKTDFPASWAQAKKRAVFLQVFGLYCIRQMAPELVPA